MHGTELSTKVEQPGTRELAVSSQESAARAEIESAIIVSRRFPRNEENAIGGLSKACSRPSFAEDAAYSFPRGGKAVTGPSVYLAKEAARLWGNLRYGFAVLMDDEKSRQIRCFAWDMETNAKSECEDVIEKVHQRKNKQTQVTEWVPVDERDLRELTNKRAAIGIRNCILSLLPSDIIEDALARARETLEKQGAADPDAMRKRLISGFASLGINADELAKYLGCPVGQANPKQISDLRTVWKSISDGNSTWAEYVAPKDTKPATTTGTVEGLSNPKGPKVNAAVATYEAKIAAATLDTLGNIAGDIETDPELSDADKAALAKKGMERQQVLIAKK